MIEIFCFQKYVCIAIMNDVCIVLVEEKATSISTTPFFYLYLNQYHENQKKKIIILDSRNAKLTSMSAYPGRK